ncbi:MAG: hypothetical protein ABI367_02165 [Mucilaginibacter sp.]
MLVAKPFAGFSLFCHTSSGRESNILIKAFSKRKLEHNEDSEFNMLAIQHRLTNPAVGLSLLFSFLLDMFFPVIISSLKSITNKTLASIRLSLFLPEHGYLLTGQLLI